jgi:hypothetical protein
MNILANNLKRQYDLYADEYEAKALAVLKITGSPVAPVRTLGSMIPDNWEALFRS